MATPPRLTEVECPRCSEATWIIDSDYRGNVWDLKSYEEREYSCAACSQVSPGWRLLQQSPPWFLDQPDSLYPMTQPEFDRWVAVLQRHFPDHPKLVGLGADFYPCTPEEAQREQAAFERAHPVALMLDQDGARRPCPTLNDAIDWIEMMAVGDYLRFVRYDESFLQVDASGDASYSARCVRTDGAISAEAACLNETAVKNLIGRYIDGALRACLQKLRSPSQRGLRRLWGAFVHGRARQ